MSTSITAIELKSALADRQPPLVIDVRRPPAFRAAPDMAAGALRRDPGAVAGWAKTLPRAASIVTYCVHGHEVSQNAAKALREIGISARYLEGGLEEGWKAAGGE
ncbi:MAG TPA: rhodanese-like domain-containing protein, partial [Burkholderiales bacterium]|nr:rhodanese-like domain-containing protein [Burkholderiales bacterium]